MVLPSLVDGARAMVTPLIQPTFVTFLYWTLASLGTIISFWTSGDRIQDDIEGGNQTTPYDFIIVGAGSAGCVLANRLSQTYSVLLLEAGGEPNPMQFIPGFSLFFPGFPELDWQYRSVPQKLATLISVNGEASLSAGLGFGGTGTLNYMIHLRGHKKDFDNWASILNDPSWSWEGVLPFFKSYEDYGVPGDNVNHGYGGNLRIEEPPDFPQSARDFVAGGVELGYANVDLNAPFTEGFDIIRFPMKNGVRQAPYKAFLEPIRFRNTLTVMKFAQVNKILFNSDSVAYGVEYDRHGKTYVAQASKEVILSAGTFGSAKLLMLSGIGPKDHLSSLNIPVLSDLPVGQNLQDHLGVYLSPFYIRPGAGFYIDRDLTIGQFIKWFTLGRGRLSNPGCEATGIISSSFAKSRGEGDWPDIQLFSYGLTQFAVGAQHQARIFNLKYDELEEFYRNDVGRDSLYITVSGARPLSRGYVELGGSSPYDRPIIDPNYLGDPEGVDLKVLLEGVKRSVYLMENTTVLGGNLQARFTSTRLPGCENVEFRSDAYWECFIRRYTVSLHHTVGTVSMGSVVDTQLRVYRTKNLRVIDASVQPTVVVTNTQASTLMIAEKGADMILKYWNAAGLKSANNNKSLLFSIFGGGGGGIGQWFGGGNNNNNLLWTGNNNNSQRNTVSIITQVAKPNKTIEGESKRPNLKYVWLGQDAPLPPSSAEIPTRHKIPNNEISEEILKQKLEKSLRELQVMSELVRANYDNGQFKRENYYEYNNPDQVTTSSPTDFLTVQNNENVDFKGNVSNGSSKEKPEVNADYNYYDDNVEDNFSSYKKPDAVQTTPVPPPSTFPPPQQKFTRKPQKNIQSYHNNNNINYQHYQQYHKEIVNKEESKSPSSGDNHDHDNTNHSIPNSLDFITQFNNDDKSPHQKKSSIVYHF